MFSEFSAAQGARKHFLNHIYTNNDSATYNSCCRQLQTRGRCAANPAGENKTKQKHKSYLRDSLVSCRTCEVISIGCSKAEGGTEDGWSEQLHYSGSSSGGSWLKPRPPPCSISGHAGLKPVCCHHQPFIFTRRLSWFQPSFQ